MKIENVPFGKIYLEIILAFTENMKKEPDLTGMRIKDVTETIILYYDEINQSVDINVNFGKPHMPRYYIEFELDTLDMMISRIEKELKQVVPLKVDKFSMGILQTTLKEFHKHLNIAQL